MASALRDSKFLVVSADRSSPVKDTVALLSAASNLSDHSDRSDSPGDLEMNSFGFGSSGKSKVNSSNGDWGTSSSTTPSNNVSSSSGAGGDSWGSSNASGRVYSGRYG